nr:protein Skeletor, isoforms B/C [Nomia melanderi]
MDATPLRLISGLLLFAYTTLSDYSDVKNAPNYYGKPIGSLRMEGRNVSGDVFAVGESMLFIKGFTYDGIGARAHFLAGNTSNPSQQDGYLIPYPPVEKGRDPEKLRAFNKTDIFLELPDRKRIRDFKWLGIWDTRITLNFGYVVFPAGLKAPETKMLSKFTQLAHGVRSGNITILDSKTFYIPNLHYDGKGPEAYFWVGNGSEPNSFGTKVPDERKRLSPLRQYQGVDIELVLPGNLTTSSTPPPPQFRYELTNCKEMLQGRVQVEWEMIGENIQIRLSGLIREDQYVAFGLSGTDGRPEMIGGDMVVVAYNNTTGEFIVEDYYISAYTQCNGQEGVCPDERVGGKNDAVLVHGKRKDGVTTVTYTRPLRTNEPVKDRMIPNSETSVIAAIGPLNPRGEANAHESFDKTTEDIRIDFSSKNVHECPSSLYNRPDAFDIKPWPPLMITNETTFSVRLGPTGGKRGYSRITGMPSREIVWYINDLLIPEVTVERGQTYTFIVEGGNDPTNPARYHPFYITTSMEGGFGQKTEEEQMAQKVFAGVKYDADGYPFPTAAGRYCRWVDKTVDMSEEMETFENFFETLRLECDKGEPAELIWTVAEDTPDVVYYQCYSQRNMGWKINVVSGASATLPIMSMIITLVLGLTELSR